jgi:hypothetical protein
MAKCWLSTASLAGFQFRLQYKANGYKPPCDKLPPEVPLKARKEFAHAEA